MIFARVFNCSRESGNARNKRELRLFLFGQTWSAPPHPPPDFKSHRVHCRTYNADTRKYTHIAHRHTEPQTPNHNTTCPSHPCFVTATQNSGRTLISATIVSLSEQQFVDSVSHRSDELEPLGHETLPHFSPTPPFLFRTESEDSAVLMSQLCLFFFFFEFRRICHSTRLLILFPARLSALFFTLSNKGPPCLQRKVHKFNRFFLHRVITPAPKSVGPGF